MLNTFGSSRPAHGGNRRWAAQLAGVSSHDLLDFSASINPLGLPQTVLRCLEAQIDGIQAYPDPEYLDLRSALAALHQLSPEWVLPGNGSAELLTWAGRELADLEITYGITPAFGDYQRALTAFSARLQPWVMSPWCEEVESLDSWQAIAALSDIVPHHCLEFRATDQAANNNPAPCSRGLLLNNPHNPTGLLLTRASLLQYLNEFELVVVDEAFMDFVALEQQQSLIDWVEQYPQLVILRSLTKFFCLPGLRLGYAIAHPDRLRRWQSWRDPWPVNSFAAAAGIVAAQDTAFQAATRNWMAQAQPQLFQGLTQIPGLAPLASTVNFFLVRSQRAVQKLQLQLLQRHHLLIRDCLSFPELGDDYFRVAVRTEAENQRLLEALAIEMAQDD